MPSIVANCVTRTDLLWIYIPFVMTPYIICLNRLHHITSPSTSTSNWKLVIQITRHIQKAEQKVEEHFQLKTCPLLQSQKFGGPVLIFTRDEIQQTSLFTHRFSYTTALKHVAEVICIWWIIFPIHTCSSRASTKAEWSLYLFLPPSSSSQFLLIYHSGSLVKAVLFTSSIRLMWYALGEK